VHFDIENGELAQHYPAPIRRRGYQLRYQYVYEFLLRSNVNRTLISLSLWCTEAIPNPAFFVGKWFRLSGVLWTNYLYNTIPDEYIQAHRLNNHPDFRVGEKYPLKLMTATALTFFELVNVAPEPAMQLANRSGGGPPLQLSRTGQSTTISTARQTRASGAAAGVQPSSAAFSAALMAASRRDAPDSDDDDVLRPPRSTRK
jgi:hypothetical protein